MKRIIPILVVTILNCQVDIKQLPQPRNSSTINLAASNLPLYFGKFEIYSAESYNLSSAWKYTIKTILKHNRVFFDIYDLNEETIFKPDSYILDLAIYPKYNDDYNYWWTWPNVYPFTGTWPVQVRTGKYEISIDYTLSKDGKIIKQNKVTESDSLTIYIFGTYRTSDLEKMIEVTNLKVLDKCAKDIYSNLQ